MVATVLRLRYRVLGNTLARSPWQVVGFAFGVLGALWAVTSVVGGMIALAVFQDLAVARTVAVLGGALLLTGWLLGPLVVAGMDTTVDAGRLAPFPLSRGQVMACLDGALGLLLVGYGVTAVSSALIVVPVAAPGDNPFASVPGQTFLSGLLVFVVWAACLVLAGVVVGGRTLDRTGPGLLQRIKAFPTT